MSKQYELALEALAKYGRVPASCIDQLTLAEQCTIYRLLGWL